MPSLKKLANLEIGVSGFFVIQDARTPSLTGLQRSYRGDDTVDQLLDTFKNLGPARLAMMLVTFFGLIIFFIFIAMRSSADCAEANDGHSAMASAMHPVPTL